MRHLALVLLVCSLLGCGSTPKRDDYTQSVTGNYSINPEQPLRVVFSNSAQCDFRVEYDVDNTVSSAHVLYDGSAGLGGFLAQIAVHAAINNSAQEAKLAENQERANRYLKPIKEVLNTISHADLVLQGEQFQFAMVDSVENSDEQKESNVLISHPIFFFSEDLQTLTLKHIVKVQDKDARNPRYQNMVEVISVVDSPNAEQYWRNSEQEHLLKRVKKLYKDSLQIVHKELSGQLKTDAKQKNHRITVNEKLRVERGSQVMHLCDQMVIRNLRGWLIAYPDDSTSDCKA